MYIVGVIHDIFIFFLKAPSAKTTSRFALRTRLGKQYRQQVEVTRNFTELKKKNLHLENK